MRNVIAFFLAAIMSAAIVFIAALLFFPSEEKNEPEDSLETSFSLTVSQSDRRASLFKFSFAIGDEEYSLPCHYDAFERNGWVLKNPTEKIKGSSNMTGVYMKKAKRSLKAEIINYSNETIMCCKGQIHSVSVGVGDFGQIAVFGAITCDRYTTPEIVRQKLGDPNFFDEDDEKITLTYQKEEYRKVMFIFYKKRPYGYSDHLEYDSLPLESGYFEHAVVFECRKDF